MAYKIYMLENERFSVPPSIAEVDQLVNQVLRHVSKSITYTLCISFSAALEEAEELRSDQARNDRHCQREEVVDVRVHF